MYGQRLVALDVALDRERDQDRQGHRDGQRQGRDDAAEEEHRPGAGEPRAPLRDGGVRVDLRQHAIDQVERQQDRRDADHEQRPTRQARLGRIDERPPQPPEDGVELARCVPLDPVERAAAQDEEREEHPGQVLDHRHRHRLDTDAEPDGPLALVAKRVEEPGDEHDERCPEPRARQHRQGLELRDRTGAEQADRRGGHGRARQHEVGAEPARPQRRQRVRERERAFDRGTDRGGAGLHQLDRQDEQEHRRHEQQGLAEEEVAWALDVTEDRAEVDVVADLALFLRDAELAVDLARGAFHLREVAVRLGHAEPLLATGEPDSAAYRRASAATLRPFGGSIGLGYIVAAQRVNEPGGSLRLEQEASPPPDPAVELPEQEVIDRDADHEDHGQRREQRRHVRPGPAEQMPEPGRAARRVTISSPAISAFHAKPHACCRPRHHARAARPGR